MAILADTLGQTERERKSPFRQMSHISRIPFRRFHFPDQLDGLQHHLAGILRPLSLLDAPNRPDNSPSRIRPRNDRLASNKRVSSDALASSYFFFFLLLNCNWINQPRKWGRQLNRTWRGETTRNSTRNPPFYQKNLTAIRTARK